MLNVDVIMSRKELSYMTMKNDNYETLFGSIMNPFASLISVLTVLFNPSAGQFDILLNI